MRNEQQNSTPTAIRIYRKLRFVLVPLVLLLMAVSLVQLIRIYREYEQSENAYREAGEAYLTERAQQPETPAAEQQGPIEVRETATPAPQIPGETSAAEAPSEEPSVPDEPFGTTPAPGEAHDPYETTPLPNVTEAPSAAGQPETAPFSVNFDELIDTNDECVGWICIPDTIVNYPVMQARTNSKYLDRLPDGTKNSAGSIFMDFSNDSLLSDRNTILYGHHMKSGQMFTTLDKYYGKTFFNAHRTAYYLTPDGDYKITILAAADVSAFGDSYDLFDSDEALHAYLKDLLKSAKASASVDVDSVERIITLSTCTTKNGRRTVVVGALTPLG